MTVKRPRKHQSQTATGKHLAMTLAAKASYPSWPRDLVDQLEKRRDRQRALGWFDNFIKHRAPDGWQPADPGRIAQLANAYVIWQRELQKLANRDGGDLRLCEAARAGAAQLSRQLGLSTAIRDPRLLANDAMVRAELDQHELELAGDDLLARPGRLN